jgi:DNA-directed RNA polymerase subunit omega
MMIFPLEELIGCEKNMYEITTASSHRSYQLSMLYAANEDRIKYWIDDNDGKVVSLAARQVFTREIEFRLDAN